MTSAEERRGCGSCPGGEEAHYYGGQAVMEGVMMRGTDRYAVAVRRADGEVVLGEQPISNFADRHPWAKWPLIRGNVGLIDGLALGMKALFWSADVLTQEERERLAAEKAAEAADAPDADPAAQSPAEPASGPEPQKGLDAVAKWVTIAISFAVAICVFVLLPTWAVDWFSHDVETGTAWWTWDKILRNVVEGGIRLAVLLLYIVAISRMQYVSRLFQYHGAEHAAINCYEAGEAVTPANVIRYSTLHPRCGTAFLFVVIIVKVILGWFFGWPELGLRLVIRFGLLPVVAGIGYEVIRWAGRHRDSSLSRVLAAPGMLMQRLTTQKPDEEQAEVAIYALAAVAPEVGLPAELPEARRLPIPLIPKTEPDTEPAASGGADAP